MFEILYVLPICITLVSIAGIIAILKSEKNRKEIFGLVLGSDILLLFSSGTIQSEGANLGYMILIAIISGILGIASDKLK